jgi:hypothetical protein
MKATLAILLLLAGSMALYLCGAQQQDAHDAVACGWASGGLAAAAYVVYAFAMNRGMAEEKS